MPSGCQKCKFFRKHLFGNGLDYSYSCMLGAKDFPMPWIRQMEERASDCPIVTFDNVRAEIAKYESDCRLSEDEYPSCKQCTDSVFGTIYGILDKIRNGERIDNQEMLNVIDKCKSEKEDNNE